MNEEVLIDYTNHRGERRQRQIRPKAMRFGSTAWHHQDQWLLDAHDLEKHEERTFALKDIHSWTPVS